jgi:hypothetical protein
MAGGSSDQLVEATVLWKVSDYCGLLVASVVPSGQLGAKENMTVYPNF